MLFPYQNCFPLCTDKEALAEPQFSVLVQPLLYKSRVHVYMHAFCFPGRNLKPLVPNRARKPASPLSGLGMYPQQTLVTNNNRTQLFGPAISPVPSTFLPALLGTSWVGVDAWKVEACDPRDQNDPVGLG
jgi:hypothetical protein